MLHKQYFALQQAKSYRRPLGEVHRIIPDVNIIGVLTLITPMAPKCC